MPLIGELEASGKSAREIKRRVEIWHQGNEEEVLLRNADGSTIVIPGDIITVPERFF